MVRGKWAGLFSKKENKITKALGVIFIIFSLFYLANFFKMLILDRQAQLILREVPFDFIDFYLAYLWNFFLYLFAGIWLLRQRLWARYLALIVTGGGVIGFIWDIWLFGYQKQGLFSYIFTSLYLLIFLFFIRQEKAKERLPAKIKTALGIILIPVILQVISMVVWCAGGRQIFEQKHPGLMLKPQKVQYAVVDQNYLLRHCKKTNIYNYSIYLPDGVALHRETPSRSVFWLRDESKTELSITLHDKSVLDEADLWRWLKFNSAYEFERRINYASWSPFYMILKAMVNSMGLEEIEEVTTANWRGFIRIAKRDNIWTLDATLYNPNALSSAGITINFKEGTMSLGQAKDIITSVTFE